MRIPRLHSGQAGSVLPIAVMALAIGAFIFVVFWAATPGLQWPWSTKINANIATNTLRTTPAALNTNETAGNTNSTDSNLSTNQNTNTVVNTNIVATPTTASNNNTNAISNSNTNTAADWKSYKNSQFGISFQYPPTWSVSTTTNNGATAIAVMNGGRTEIFFAPQGGFGHGVSGVLSQSIATIGGQLARTTVYQGQGGAPDYTFYSFAYYRYYSWSEENRFEVTPADTADSAILAKILASITLQDPTIGWKTYTNTDLKFSLKMPQDWEVDTSRSTANEIVFLPNAGTESREAVKSVVSSQTLEAWEKTLDQASVTKQSDISVAMQLGKRVETNAFGLNYIGIRYSDRLYVITTNTKMLDLGVLYTLKFLP